MSIWTACREMLGKRTKARTGALSAWLWRCRVSVGEVKGRTFVKPWLGQYYCMEQKCGDAAGS